MVNGILGRDFTSWFGQWQWVLLTEVVNVGVDKKWHCVCWHYAVVQWRLVIVSDLQ